MPLRPLHHLGYGSAKPRLDQTATLTAENRRNNTLTQIIRNDQTLTVAQQEF